ncbi:MAG: DMT family transporter, partial [Betaproteobacteria bacterium]|nr:DMT family transporter [Betaproteobacteria bacterium]
MRARNAWSSGTKCCASKKSWAPPRPLPAAPHWAGTARIETRPTQPAARDRLHAAGGNPVLGHGHAGQARIEELPAPGTAVGAIHRARAVHGCNRRTAHGHETAALRTRRSASCAGLLLVFSTTLFYLSLQFMPLAQTAAISFVSPLIVTLLARPLLKEKVRTRQWVAVILGFIGVLVIIRPGGVMFQMISLLPVATAVCFSFYQILTRVLAGREHPYTTLFYTGLIGTVVSSAALPFHWIMPSLWQGVLMVGV